jgi:hypothetical protein
LELSGRGHDPVTAAVPDGPIAAALADLFAAPLGDGIEAAERFAFLHAAAACAHLWRANPTLPLYGAAPGSTGWLAAVTALLTDRAHGRTTRLSAADADAALDVVTALHAGGRLFSAVPLPLANATDHGWPTGDDR